MFIKKMIYLLDINKNPFIGLYGILTDKFAIFSENFPNKNLNLNVPILKTKIYGSDLIGVFCAGNSKGIVVTDFITDKEKEKMEKFFNSIGINFGVIHNDYNSLGNLISCNDKGCIVSEKISDENIKKISEILDVECVKLKIENYDIVGSIIVVTNNGFLVHPDAKFYIEKLKEIFKVDGNIGTVNMGFPYVRLGILGNSTDLLIGDTTTGIEMKNISDCLKVY